MEDPTKEPPPRTPTVTPAVFQWTLWFDFDTLISISERAMKLLETNLPASTRLKDTEETTSNATVQLSSPSALSWPFEVLSANCNYPLPESKLLEQKHDLV
uniref:Uncharacterized protein n=1 Tax=Solanum tuberosum TaxID=4113 RepID=M1BNY5_SOLTU